MRKGGRWQKALSLMGQMQSAGIRPDVISFSATISACQKGGQWEMALTKLGEPDEKPQIAIIDIPDEGGYYVSEATEVTADGVAKFLADYKAGSLERRQMSK